MRPIQHLYPDELPAPTTTRCYSLEEVFAEKIRALGERGWPRDLYDVSFLLDHPALVDHADLVQSTLTAKCASKGVPEPSFESVATGGRRAELEADWHNMLAHQLPALPPLDHYWTRLAELFEWLTGQTRSAALSAVAGDNEPIWSPTPTRWAWGTGPALEPIRFAGANLLCVNLGYHGSRRMIRPYSLRVSRDGNLLLYAAKDATGELRAYRVDRIESAEVTTQPFTPTHRVEFRPTGELSAPPIGLRFDPPPPSPRTASSAPCAARSSAEAARTPGSTPTRTPTASHAAGDGATRSREPSAVAIATNQQSREPADSLSRTHDGLDAVPATNRAGAI